MSHPTSWHDAVLAVGVTLFASWLAVVSAPWWRRTLKRHRRGGTFLVILATACVCMVFGGIAALMGVGDLLDLGVPFAVAMPVMLLPLGAGIAAGVWTHRWARSRGPRRPRSP